MRKTVLTVIACTLLVAVFFGAFLQSAPAAQASVPQPLLAPTPVSIQPVAPSKIVFPMYSGVITQAQRTAAFNFKNMRIADIQYVIDATLFQTLTARLDYSNDGVHWVAGPTVINAASTDTTDMQEFYTFGGYGSFTLTLGSTDPANPITVTLTAAGQ